MKTVCFTTGIFLTLAVSALANVSVSSPTNGATVNSPVHYVATATTTCSKGVASMGIYVDNNLVYVVNGAKMDHNQSISSGKHHTVVEEWDYCKGATYTAVDITVQGGG